MIAIFARTPSDRSLLEFWAAHESSRKSSSESSREPSFESSSESSREPCCVWFDDWGRLESQLKAALPEITSIVVQRLDFSARELSTLFADLIQRGVDLIAVADSFQLSTPEGRCAANVLASVIRYETEAHAERVLAGQAEARARGVKWGGGKIGRRCRVTPDKEATIKQMHAEGKKIAAIARAVSLTRPTIYTWLHRPNTCHNT
ncbi:MAG: recombinase family protein [Thermoguttaceae bacterium]